MGHLLHIHMASLSTPHVPGKYGGGDLSHSHFLFSLSLFFGSGERELHMYGVALIPSAMLPLRCLLKTTPGIRSHARLFSTVNPSARELAYQAFGPEQGDQVERNPIIFLHGLFGSKANNRSVSR